MTPFHKQIDKLFEPDDQLSHGNQRSGHWNVPERKTWFNDQSKRPRNWIFGWPKCKSKKILHATQLKKQCTWAIFIEYWVKIRKIWRTSDRGQNRYDIEFHVKAKNVTYFWQTAIAKMNAVSEFFCWSRLEKMQNIEQVSFGPVKKIRYRTPLEKM